MSLSIVCDFILFKLCVHPFTCQVQSGVYFFVECNLFCIILGSGSDDCGNGKPGHFNH